MTGREKLYDLMAVPEMFIPALLIASAVMAVFAARNIQLFNKSFTKLKDLLVHEAGRGDLFFSRYQVTKDTAFKLKKLGMPLSYSTFLTVNAVISSALAVLSIKLMSNQPLAILSVVLWVLFAHQLVDRLYHKRIKSVIELQAQLMLQLLAELNQVSGNLRQAIERVIPATPQPLKKELEDLILNVNTNRDFDDCLLEFAGNLDNRDINTFVQGIVLSRQYGSDTHEVIKMLSEVVRERMDLREELVNETRGKKAVIYIFMAALPAVFLWMFTGSADARRVFTETSRGHMLVSLLVITEYLCWYFDGRKGVLEEL
ncbi:MAG: type II secretion system F family protein [Actinobacteria bacterium]|nr:type II secretion system F family protein [Actinomycetota bacterium]